MGSTQKIGALGEELVVKFLMKRGYKILDRNYRRPWGELDVIAERKSKIHFVEVKALSSVVMKRQVTPVVKSLGFDLLLGSAHETVSLETQREKALVYVRANIRKDGFRPEENMTRNKALRLRRIIQTYLMGKHVSNETDWQFDVATVLIDSEKKIARIKLLEDIILEQRRK